MNGNYRARVAVYLALAILIAGCNAGQSRPPGPNVTGQAASGLQAEVFARGLIKPRGLAFGPDGSLYVAEAGTGGPNVIDLGLRRPHTFGFTGRLTRFGPDGSRTVVADNLPSIFTAYDEESGPSGLAFLGNELYLLTASGGWEVGDPAFHSGLFRVKPDGRLELVFDYTAYAHDHPARARLEDPRAGVPFGMPYGLTALNGRLYTTDGNHEQVLAVTPDGEATRIFEHPRSNRALTGITPGPEGALYVAEYAGSRITRITLDGRVSEFASKLQTPIGVAFDPSGRLYILEYTRGRVAEVSATGQTPRYVLSEGRPESTALAFGPDGALYISTGGGGNADRASTNPEGQIWRLRLNSRG